MAEPIGALRAEMSAGHAQFASDMKKAKDAVVSNAKGMEQGMNRAKKSFDGGMISLNSFKVGAIAAAAGTVMLMRSIVKTADQYTLLDNKLKLVTKSEAELASVQEGLYQQSLRSHSSYESSVDLYSRFAKATETMGTSQGDLLRITETLNKSMIISGATQEEARNGIIQLSQGMASGVLRGEEFNSIMENGSRIAKMLADYLHTDVGGLRKMATEGKITSDIMVKAFSASAGKIDEEFGKMQPTIAQAMTDLKTVFGRLVSDSNTAAGGTKSVAGEIQNLSTVIDQNREGIIELFTGIISLAAQAVRLVGKLGREIQLWQGMKRGQLGLWDYLSMEDKEIDAWIKKNNTVAAKTKALQGQIADVDRRIAELPHVGGIPGNSLRSPQLYKDKLADLQKERKEIEAEIAKLQAPIPTPTGGGNKGGAGGGKKTGKVGGAGKTTKSTKDIAAETIASLTKERDMIGLVTEEEKVRWEITNGTYKGFTAKQKDKLLLLAKEIDILAAASDQRKAGKDAVDDMSKELGLLRAVTNEEKIKWEIENGSYKDLAPAMQEKLIALAKQLDTTKALIDEEEKRKSNADQINQEIEALKVQAATFNMTATEAEAYRLKLSGATEEQIRSKTALLEDIESKEQLKQVLDDLITPADEFNDTLRVLNELMAAGKITTDQFSKSLKNAEKKRDDALKDGSETMNDLKQSIEGWGRDATNTLVDFALEGKNSFSDFADSVIKDILRMLIYQNLMKPLFGGISNAAGSDSSWISTGISLVGGLFGGGKASGGSVSPGKLYEVNETGIPELLNIGSRQFLMMSNRAGYVTPQTEDGGSTGGNNISISVPITMEGSNKMASELRYEMEAAAERVIKRYS